MFQRKMISKSGARNPEKSVFWIHNDYLVFAKFATFHGAWQFAAEAPMNKAATLGLALLLVGAFLGSALVYEWTSTNREIAQNNSALELQIAGLQSSVGFVENTLSQSQQNSNAQQISSIGASLQTLQAKLTSLGTQLNATEAGSSAQQQSLSQQLQNMTATVKTLSAEVKSLTARVPISTLVVVNDSYNPTTKTFTFIIDNTQNVTVLAQLNVQVYGNCGCGFSGMGFFISPVYQFNPHVTTTAQYNTTLTSFNPPQVSQQPVNFSLILVAGGNVNVSPSYTFEYQ